MNHEIDALFQHENEQPLTPEALYAKQLVAELLGEEEDEFFDSLPDFPRIVAEKCTMDK